jgi:hypothetical protein
MTRQQVEYDIAGILENYGEAFLNDDGVDSDVCESAASEIADHVERTYSPRQGMSICRNGPSYRLVISDSKASFQIDAATVAEVALAIRHHFEDAHSAEAVPRQCPLCKAAT